MDVSGDVRTARRWTLCARATQVCAVAISAYIFVIAFVAPDNSTVNGTLSGTNPDVAGGVALTVSLAALLILPLTSFAARGSRFWAGAAAVLLFTVSSIALLHAIGTGFDSLARPGVERVRELAAFVSSAFHSRYPPLWGIVAILGLAILVPIILAIVSGATAVCGFVLALRARPHFTRMLRQELRYGFSWRGAALFVLSLLLWVPTLVLAFLAAAMAGMAFSPILNLKHNVLTYILWMSLRWGLPADSNVQVIGPILTQHLEVGFVAFLIMVVGLVLVSFLARLTWGIGRRMTQYGALKLRERDARKPLFLIRSFKDDTIAVADRLDWRLLLGRVRARIGFEQVIVSTLWEYGPVLTIGKPGDRVAPLGAAREYLGDDLWRDRVQQYFEDAKAIVIVLGDTANFAWECERVTAFGLAGHVLAIMPPVDAPSIATRWSNLRRHFSPAAEVNLPELPPGHYPLVVAFANDGSARFVTCRWRTRDAYEAAISAAWPLTSASQI
jgi:hypothetical protein